MNVPFAEAGTLCMGAPSLAPAPVPEAIVSHVYETARTRVALLELTRRMMVARPLILVGPAECGKTAHVFWLAALSGKPLRHVDLSLVPGPYHALAVGSAIAAGKQLGEWVLVSNLQHASPRTLEFMVQEVRLACGGDFRFLATIDAPIPPPGLDAFDIIVHTALGVEELVPMATRCGHLRSVVAESLAVFHLAAQRLSADIRTSHFQKLAAEVKLTDGSLAAMRELAISIYVFVTDSPAERQALLDLIDSVFPTTEAYLRPLAQAA